MELAEKHGWFLQRQFENEANADMHSRTTAREILEDFKGERLDYWVTGFGTGGTLKGVARVLAKERPETKIVVCEPDDAPMLSSGIEQERNPDGSGVASHPSWKPHPMQGWSPDFIPKLTADAMQTKVVSQILRIKNAEAMAWSKELARKEGIFVGIIFGCDICGSAASGSRSSEGIDDSVHVAGHRRTLSEYSPLRRRSHRYDGGGVGDRAFDAGCLGAACLIGVPECSRLARFRTKDRARWERGGG